MTPDEVNAEVDRILRVYDGDPGAGHLDEDALVLRLLRYAADGNPVTDQWLALQRLLNADVYRWYS